MEDKMQRNAIRKRKLSVFTYFIIFIIIVGITSLTIKELDISSGFEEILYQKDIKSNVEQENKYYINKIKNEYVKKYGYPITLEILSCDRRDKQSYEKTHDRRVISNYFFATASHKLKAFRNGTPLQKQKIDLLTLYAKGLGDLSDVPEYAHADDIKDLRYVMQESKNHPTLHMYSVNGNVNDSAINAKNRILI